jgi:hypothetical protein
MFAVPSLHPPVLTLPDHKTLVANRLQSIALSRVSRALVSAIVPSAATSIDIPLTTVSLQGNFDASINITYRGAQAGQVVPLLVDSGNTCLIVPKFADIASLPNFSSDYAVLAYNVWEPWQCPANVVRGPICIPTPSGTYEIPDCVFYACTGPNASGARTGNFGTGCISPWTSTGGITVQSPLSFDANFAYAEFNYAPAGTVLTAASQPNVAQGSSLTLYRSMPPGYRTFDIIKNLPWMSLRPRALGIGYVETYWPGPRFSIAMVDTAGGPVFLSDPDGYVYRSRWPDPVQNPGWVSSPGSLFCQSTEDNITITLGDQRGSFTYAIDTSGLPASVQGLTLVMCARCFYMMNNNGMNIGGISALFNNILIDYSSAKVGFKAKTALTS